MKRSSFVCLELQCLSMVHLRREAVDVPTRIADYVLLIWKGRQVRSACSSSFTAPTT